MDTLAQLVVIPSESTHEGDIARFIKQWLDERGIKTYRQDGNAMDRTHLPMLLWSPTLSSCLRVSNE